MCYVASSLECVMPCPAYILGSCCAIQSLTPACNLCKSVPVPKPAKAQHATLTLHRSHDLTMQVNPTCINRLTASWHEARLPSSWLHALGIQRISPFMLTGGFHVDRRNKQVSVSPRCTAHRQASLQHQFGVLAGSSEKTSS